MQTLDRAFFALSDPTRRAILERLLDGEATVMELAEPFDMSQPAISRHLKVLEAAGMIERRVEGAKRPCRVVPGGLVGVEGYLRQMREVLTANYGRLDAVLTQMQPTRESDP